MNPDDITTIEEVEYFCSRCGIKTTYYIEETRAVCTQCGKREKSEEVIKEAEETGFLDNQDSFEQMYKQ